MTTNSTAALSAINFALQADEGLEFLRVWREGDFDAIRREWPEAPEDVFVGADPWVPTRLAGHAVFTASQSLDDLKRISPEFVDAVQANANLQLDIKQ